MKNNKKTQRAQIIAVRNPHPNSNPKPDHNNNNVTWAESPPKSNQFLLVIHRTPPKHFTKIRRQIFELSD